MCFLNSIFPVVSPHFSHLPVSLSLVLILSLQTTAIKGLPSDLTKDYRTALDMAPDIVMAEAHPLRFLRCCRRSVECRRTIV